MSDVLCYAPRTRRRFGRVIAIFAAAIIATVAVRKYSPIAWERVQSIYWQHQCMTFSPAADAVVYEVNLPGAPSAASPAGYTSLPAQTLTGRAGSVICRVPACWVDLCAANHWIAMRNYGPEAILFLHELKTFRGLDCLVAITLPHDLCNAYAITSDMRVRISEPGTPLRDASWPTDFPVIYSGLWAPGPQRFYAGQVDPADSSHFTISYQWADGRRGSVDGWLKDDGSAQMDDRGEAPSLNGK